MTETASLWLTNGRVYDVNVGSFQSGDIEVRNGRIAEIGKYPGGNAARIDLNGAFVLPGFIDCHVHLCAKTETSDPSGLWHNALPGEIALYAARSARRLLMCGITTARDVGGWDYHEIAVREAIASGMIEGPRLFCSGRILSITSSTTPYYRGMYEEADGEAAVQQAARKQLAAGADFIKLLATGAVTSTKYEKAEAIQYRLEEIAAAVKIATDNLTYVAAHAHADIGIRNAVEAGCRSIEHGSFGTEATYRDMAKREVWLVPTLCTTPAMFKDPKFAAKVPEHIRTRYQEVHATRVSNMALARKCGVKVAMGTDAGTPGNHFGHNMQEVEVMVNEAGFSPAEAIRAATIEAARMLRQDSMIGSLEAGKFADLIAVAEDPLQNPSALGNVAFVMKAGRVHKRDGVPLPYQ
ncbi:MAG TPA: amidohydrolase family protein [Dongiaceae bacterium]|jgi:imidazolonepropionase-like amidohydrolase